MDSDALQKTGGLYQELWARQQGALKRASFQAKEAASSARRSHGAALKPLTQTPPFVQGAPLAPHQLQVRSPSLSHPVASEPRLLVCLLLFR